MSTLRFAVIVILVVLVFASGCTAPTPTPLPPTAVPTKAAPTAVPPAAIPPTVAPTKPAATPEPTKPAAAAPTAAPTVAPTAAPKAGAAWAADGVVTPGEYAHEATFGQVQVWWRNDAKSLYLAMSGKTTGWVSVGLAPDNRMQGANYIFGYVANGKAQVFDAYGQGATGATHPADQDAGGRNDIIASGGSERDGVTLIEAQIPLDSGDKFDKALKPGETVKVIAALGGADDFSARHAFRGSGEIVLDKAN
jgi:hypothetical protein